jgi:hypothetical protein
MIPFCQGEHALYVSSGHALPQNLQASLSLHLTLFNYKLDCRLLVSISFALVIILFHSCGIE